MPCVSAQDLAAGLLPRDHGRSHDAGCQERGELALFTHPAIHLQSAEELLLCPFSVHLCVVPELVFLIDFDVSLVGILPREVVDPLHVGSVEQFGLARVGDLVDRTSYRDVRVFGIGVALLERTEDLPLLGTALELHATVIGQDDEPGDAGLLAGVGCGGLGRGGVRDRCGRWRGRSDIRPEIRAEASGDHQADGQERVGPVHLDSSSMYPHFGADGL